MLIPAIFVTHCITVTRVIAYRPISASPCGCGILTSLDAHIVIADPEIMAINKRIRIDNLESSAPRDDLMVSDANKCLGLQETQRAAQPSDLSVLMILFRTVTDNDIRSHFHR